MPAKIPYDKTKHPALVRGFCLQDRDATDAKLAFMLGISRRTLQYWKTRHPEFKQAVHDGKHVCDSVVASRLYDRATGCEITEQKAVTVAIGEGQSELQIVDLKKEIPPDTAAAKHWLALRDPERWKDRQEMVTFSVDVDFSEWVSELRRRFGDPVAKQLLEQQGYKGDLIEGEFSDGAQALPVSPARAEPHT